jgi:hypothetical protein
MTITRTTYLEAVNLVLRMMGEAPVDSLDGQFGLAQQAADSILTVSRKLQSEAWSFNTDYQRTLLRDVISNQINLPANALRVEVNPYDYSSLDIVQRGDKLYDRKGGTYAFTQDITADVTYGLDWEELPEHARRYIAVTAGRELQQSIIGSRDLDQVNYGMEVEAKSAFYEIETTTSSHNMLQGNPNITGPYLSYIPSQALRR